MVPEMLVLGGVGRKESAFTLGFRFGLPARAVVDEVERVVDEGEEVLDLFGVDVSRTLDEEGSFGEV